MYDYLIDNLHEIVGKYEEYGNGYNVRKAYREDEDGRNFHIFEEISDYVEKELKDKDNLIYDCDTICICDLQTSYIDEINVVIASIEDEDLVYYSFNEAYGSIESEE